MRSHRWRVALTLLVLLTLAGSPAVSQSFLRSIGVRVILPWTGLPLLVGAEATADLSFGRGSVSFFLTPRGEALLSLAADVRLSAPTSLIQTFVRLTTGIAYLDPSAFAPTPLIGAGVYYEIDIIEPILLGLAAEVLYPLAFPIPMISTSAGWSLP